MLLLECATAEADSPTESPISNKLKLFIIVGAMRFTCHFELNKFCIRKAQEKSCRAIIHTYHICISYKYAPLVPWQKDSLLLWKLVFQMQFAIRIVTI